MKPKNKINRCFVHDKALPEWVYRGIGAAVSALSVWWWLLLFAARLANKNGGVKPTTYRFAPSSRTRVCRCASGLSTTNW